VAYTEVTGGGLTTVTTSTTGTPPPSGLKLGSPPTYYEIATTAAATGSITVCINYSGIRFANEASLKLMHQEGGTWVDRTVSLDTVANVICAAVSSLSPFAVFEREMLPFAGFFAPLANAPAVNAVRAGASVPVKFSLSGGRGLDIFRPGYPSSRAVACGTNLGGAVEEASTAGQSGLQYDGMTDQYTYVWKTDSNWLGTCRIFELGLKDESPHTILVQFRTK
jgi:hypothetical protein